MKNCIHAGGEVFGGRHCLLVAAKSGQGAVVNAALCNACDGAAGSDQSAGRLIRRRLALRIIRWGLPSRLTVDEACAALGEMCGGADVAEALIKARENGMPEEQAVALAEKHCPDVEIAE